MTDQTNDPAYDPFNNPRQKKKSNDPGKEYEFWQELNIKIVECNLFKKYMCSGVGRLKKSCGWISGCLNLADVLEV